MSRAMSGTLGGEFRRKFRGLECRFVGWVGGRKVCGFSGGFISGARCRRVICRDI